MTRVARFTSLHVKVLALTAILFLLFPPAFVDGRYSVLEAALALVAVALLPEAQSSSVRPVVIPTALAALVALMLLSTIWSDWSWVTLRDALAYSLLMVAALLLARSLTLTHITAAVALMGVTALTASALLAVVAPDAAIDSWGLLQGIYGNRNGLGYVLVQALPAIIALPLRFRGAIVVRSFAVIAFIGGIVASGARTALIAAVVVGVTWLAMVVVRRWRRAIYGVAAVVGFAIVVVMLNLDRVLEMIGKDATGSGRTRIWEALLPIIGERPMFGTGWAMAWPAGSPQLEAMVDTFNKPFFHAHNEAMNWLVTVGIVGLVLVVAVYGFTAWAGWRVWSARVAGAPFVLLSLVMIVSRGLTEISETAPQGWVVLTVAAAAGAQHVARNGRVPAAILLTLEHRRPAESNAKTKAQAN